MQMSEQGLVGLIADEGEVLRAYRDVVGVWTIGVGLTAASGVVKPVAGMTITRAQSRALLQQALTRNYAPAVARRMGEVAQHVFDAALSFHFNTGAITRASWPGKFLRGDMAGARASFLSWNKAGGRVVNGLVDRRAREWKLLSTGQYHRRGVRASTSDPYQDARGLRSGARGDDVRALQADLISLGHLEVTAADGIFGASTDAAVRSLQAAHPNLKVDGVAGVATLATIKRLRLARAGVGSAAAIPLVTAGLIPLWSWRAAIVASLVAACGFGALLWRYRDEVRMQLGRLPAGRF